MAISFDNFVISKISSLSAVALSAAEGAKADRQFDQHILSATLFQRFSSRGGSAFDRLAAARLESALS
ncbi:MAG: hypothetical protein ABSA67_02675 [Candidatus Brocadiia bacterium]|jgi:hypothetical protein